MADEVYGLTENAARKLAANDRRLAHIPHGGDGAPYQVFSDGQNWCWFDYAEFYRQNGTAGDAIAPGYSTALESGAANPGAGYLYFAQWFGDHRNVGLQMVRQDAYGNPWAKVKRTGLFYFDITLQMHYDAHRVLKDTGAVTGPASAGTAHTHTLSGYFDDARATIARTYVRMQRRTTGSGSWSNLDDWQFYASHLGNVSLQTSQYELFRYHGLVRLQSGWDIRIACSVENQRPSLTYNPVTLHRAMCNMLAEYWGPSDDAFKLLTTYQVSP